MNKLIRKTNYNTIKEQIQDITKRLEELEIRHKKESILIEEEIVSIKEELIQIVNSIPDSDNQRFIQVGSTVRITNNYKSEYGVIGEVVKFKKDWVWIKDVNDQIHRRAHFNVEFLKNELNDYETNDAKYFGGTGFRSKKERK